MEICLGDEFKGKKGSVIKVVGKTGKPCRNGKTLIVECSVCSQDKELFPNPFLVSIPKLKKGYCPCKCNMVRWSEDQIVVRVQRECEKRGYIFLGFVGGRYTKIKDTRLKLHNPSFNSTWETTCVDSFLRGAGCYEEGLQKLRVFNTVDQTEVLKSIEASTSFYNIKNPTRKGHETYWSLSCRTCSDDGYVKRGLCSGVFTSPLSSLKRGIKPCRCGSRYTWTKGQREFQIKTFCKKEGLEFKGWIDDYKTSYSKLKWICSEGHECSNSVHSFVNGGVRCGHCTFTKNQNQLYINLVSEGDLPVSIKFGISCDYKTRLNNQNNTSSLTVTNLKVYKFNEAALCREVETSLKRKLACNYLSKVDFPDGYTETTSINNLNAIYEECVLAGAVPI